MSRGSRRVQPRLEPLEGRALPSFAGPTLLPTGDLPNAVVVGDFNGDTNADIAVTNAQDDAVGILLGNGNGTFQASHSFPAGTTPVALAAGDFDGDGHLDLAATNGQPQGRLVVLRGNGDGTFHAPQAFATGSEPVALAVTDFNGDTKPDLVTANQNGRNVSVLIGNGNGTFQAAVNIDLGVKPEGVSAGDVNLDGKPDIVTANLAEFPGTTGSVSVLLGKGNGTFQAPVQSPTTGSAYAIALGDLNADGPLDAVVTERVSNTIEVLPGNGDGTFGAGHTYHPGQSPGGVTIRDFTGDGRLDLAATALGLTFGSPVGRVSVLVANGDGTFQTPVAFDGGADPQGIAPADFDKDGKTDLVAADQVGDQAVVLLNRPLAPATYVTGADQGDNPQVRGFDAAGTLLYRFDVYDPGVTTNGARVAVADVTGDTVPDIITAPGPGVLPEVRVIDGVTGWQIAGPAGSFLAYDPGWQGGVFVAAGDVNNDGTPDIVTGADAGGGPHVRVRDGKTAADLPFTGRPDLAAGFMAYSPAFPGGVRVAVGDVNGDGQADVITGAGPSGGPHVRVFDGATAAEIVLNSSHAFAYGFYAFAADFHGGVYVAAGDTDHDGNDDIIVGAGGPPGTQADPNVRVFSGADGSILREFSPADTGINFARVAARDHDGDGKDDVVTGPGQGQQPVQIFDVATGSLLGSFFPYDPNYLGAVFIGAA